MIGYSAVYVCARAMGRVMKQSILDDEESCRAIGCHAVWRVLAGPADAVVVHTVCIRVYNISCLYIMIILAAVVYSGSPRVYTPKIITTD